MYLEFFNFKEEPFNITPNPRFLFLSHQHEEALTALLYGVNYRKGFMSIVGDIGTGKTTLCRVLLTRLDKDTDTSVILNPMLSIQELLEAINDDFGNRTEDIQTVKEHMDALNKFLLKRLNKLNKNAVVIVDEAQNLSTESLEMLRMLSNLETDEKKLLQIILVGQPELRTKLKQPELEQLDQRIGIRYFLKALSFDETRDYIFHRLSVAGGLDAVHFDSSALSRIFEYSRGIPRLINITCDRALLSAFAVQSHIISKNIIEKAISDIEGPAGGNVCDVQNAKRQSWWRAILCRSFSRP